MHLYVNKQKPEPEPEPTIYTLNTNSDSGIILKSGQSPISGENGETILSHAGGAYTQLGTQGSNYWVNIFDMENQEVDSFIIKLRKTNNGTSITNGSWQVLSDANKLSSTPPDNSIDFSMTYVFEEDIADIQQEAQIWQYFNEMWNLETYAQLPSQDYPQTIPMNEWYYAKYTFTPGSTTTYYKVEILDKNKTVLHSYSITNSYGIVATDQQVYIGYPRYATSRWNIEVDYAETGFLKGNQWVWRAVTEIA